MTHVSQRRQVLSCLLFNFFSLYSEMIQTYRELKNYYRELLCTACVPSRSFVSDRLFATPRTVGRQAPLSAGFSRRECWSGLPSAPPGDFRDPGIRSTSPALAGGFFTMSAPCIAQHLLPPYSTVTDALAPAFA